MTINIVNCVNMIKTLNILYLPRSESTCQKRKRKQRNKKKGLKFYKKIQIKLLIISK